MISSFFVVFQIGHAHCHRDPTVNLDSTEHLIKVSIEGRDTGRNAPGRDLYSGDTESR